MNMPVTLVYKGMFMEDGRYFYQKNFYVNLTHNVNLARAKGRGRRGVRLLCAPVLCSLHAYRTSQQTPINGI